VAGVESTLRDGISAFMDTTTVFVGNALLDGDGAKLSAINLLDLDTFIRNVVLCGLPAAAERVHLLRPGRLPERHLELDAVEHPI
jgi:hypothetical protein